MAPGTIINAPAILVRYVAGDRRKPIYEQAPEAVGRLEASLASPRGKKFYGVVADGEYRACVAGSCDDADYSLPEFEIPGGRYYCQRLTSFLDDPHKIGDLVSSLIRRSDFDASRPVIEFYRGHDALSIRVPVR